MTSVNVTENKYSVNVTEGVTTVVTVKAPGPQGPGFPDGNLGDVTSSNTGANVVVNSGAITNAKVNDSAAIAGTKISPDFGSQNITTTGNAVFGGNLTVSGTTTTINSTTLTVEDKNIELGKVGSPTDITADGGGITLLGDTNHTFNWLNATDSWTSSEHIALPDNKKLKLGADDDVEIYSNGSHGFIQGKNTQNGQLHLNANNILIKNAINSKSYIRAYNNGAVELFFNNVKKAETSANGFDIPEDFVSGSGSKLTVGASQDLTFFHDSANSYIQNNTGDLIIGETNHLYFKGFTSDKSAALYFSNSLKLQTTNDGIEVTKDIKITAESVNDFESGRVRFIESNTNLNGGYIHYDGSANILKLGVHPFNDSTVGNDVDCIEIDRDTKNVALNFAGVKKAETSSQGFSLTDHLDLLDTKRIRLGNGFDFQISHDGGTANKIESGSNSLYIATDALHVLNGAQDETCIRCFANGSVELYHNNVKKIHTTSWGSFVTGTLQAANLAASTGYIHVESDNQPVKVGVGGDLSLLHDGTDSKITNITGNLLIEPKSGETAIKAIPDGGVELYHDNVKRIETTNEGISVSGDGQFYGFTSGRNLKWDASEDRLAADDNTKIVFGNSADFFIKHDPSMFGGVYNRLESVNGNVWFVNTDTTNKFMYIRSGDIQLRDWVNNKAFIHCNSADLGVDLFFDGGKKAETTATGFNILSGATNVGALIASGSSIASHAYGHGVNGILNQGLTIRAEESCLELISSSGGQHAGSILIRDSSNDGFGFVNDPTNEELQLKSFTTSNNDFFISSTGTNTSRLDNCIVIKKDGAVSLFHDGVKKAETTSTGLNVTSANNPHLLVTSDQNLNEHGYTATPVGVTIKSSEARLDLIASGSGTHAGSFLIRDSSHDGFGFVNDFTNKELQLKSFTSNNDNFSINGTGFNVSRIDNCIVIKKDGAVDLYHNGTKKAETSSTGWDVTGTVKASTGILFGSDTADANKLDDYETGTWTPALEGASSNPSSVTYVSRSGFYTKIGNIVYFGFSILVSAYSGGSGEFQIGGLPFTSASDKKGFLQWNQSHGITWPTNCTMIVPYVSLNVSRIRARGFGSNLNSGLNLSAFPTSSTFEVGAYGAYCV